VEGTHDRIPRIPPASINQRVRHAPVGPRAPKRSSSCNADHLVGPRHEREVLRDPRRAFSAMEARDIAARLHRPLGVKARYVIIGTAYRGSGCNDRESRLAWMEDWIHGGQMSIALFIAAVFTWLAGLIEDDK